eukprot:1179871-Rhodomonas_salina.1
MCIRDRVPKEATLRDRGPTSELLVRLMVFRCVCVLGGRRVVDRERGSVLDSAREGGVDRKRGRGCGGGGREERFSLHALSRCCLVALTSDSECPQDFDSELCIELWLVLGFLRLTLLGSYSNCGATWDWDSDTDSKWLGEGHGEPLEERGA